MVRVAFLTVVLLAGRQVETRNTYDANGNLLTVAPVDLRTDPSNCGRVGTVCASVSNGTGACVDGKCTITCNAGYTSCSGACRNLASDPLACGACGNVCPGIPGGGATCSSGQCGTSCSNGLVSCSGSCVAVQSNAGHCGTCGYVCPAVSNGTGMCRGGTCGIQCNEGYANCGGTCLSLVADNNNARTVMERRNGIRSTCTPMGSSSPP